MPSIGISLTSGMERAVAELQAGKKTVLELLGNEKASFHIPSYQRPYAWGVEECETLWDDICSFAVPDNSPDDFVGGSEYFLGPLVTFKQADSTVYEVIDGQQRLTTLMLLLRVLYSRLEHMNDKDNIQLRNKIEEAIWKVDEFGQPQVGEAKLQSSVASDDDLEELGSILGSGIVDDFMTSRYAENYRFFQGAVDDYVYMYPDYFKYLVNRLLRNVILLPIESEDRDSALRIFSTLNNRGLPLSDSDIFKAAMYEHYRNQGRAEEFDGRWKEIERRLAGPLLAEDSPMTELFRLYMGYLRGLSYAGSTNRPAVRDFFSRDRNAVLKEEKTLNDLEDLADFWNRYEGEEGFSNPVLKDFFVLRFAPNKLWQDAVSNYYLVNRNEDGRLDQDTFHDYLQRLIAFLYGAVAAGATSTWERREIDKEAGFLAGRTDWSPLKRRITEYDMKSALNALGPWKRINKGILAWWMMSNENQEPIALGIDFDVEHIYARKRHQNHPGEITEEQLESLGNKSLLEKRINIRAADYDFSDKRAIYRGTAGRKAGTDVRELLDLADGNDDFASHEIDARTAEIKESFLRFLEQAGVVIPEDSSDGDSEEG